MDMYFVFRTSYHLLILVHNLSVIVNSNINYIFLLASFINVIDHLFRIIQYILIPLSGLCQ